MSIIIVLFEKRASATARPDRVTINRTPSMAMTTKGKPADDRRRFRRTGCYNQRDRRGNLDPQIGPPQIGGVGLDAPDRRRAITSPRPGWPTLRPAARDRRRTARRW